MTDCVVETIRQYDEDGIDPREGVELLELIDRHTQDDGLDYADVRHIMDEIDVDNPDDIPPYRFTEADDVWQRRFGQPRYEKEPELLYENQETGETLSFFHGYGENYPGKWKFPEDHEESRTVRGTVKQLPFWVASGISWIQDHLERREDIQFQAVYRGDLKDLRQRLERYHRSEIADDDVYHVGDSVIRFRDSSVTVTRPASATDDEPAPVYYLDELTPVEYRVVGDTEASFVYGTPITDPALADQAEQEIDGQQDDD